MRSLDFGGRMVTVGLLGGAAGATLPMDALLYRHLQLFGTLRLVIDSRYALADAAEAHRRMEAGLNVGKIRLLPGMAGRSQPLAC